MSVISLVMSILPPHSFGFGISMTCAILYSSDMSAAFTQTLSNVLSLDLVLEPDFLQSSACMPDGPEALLQDIIWVVELLNIKKEYRSTLRARIRLQQQRQIVDNIIRRQQNFDLNKGAMIKSIMNRKRQRIVLDHTRTKNIKPDLWKSWKHRFEPIESIPDYAFDGVMDELTNKEFEHILSHTSHNKAPGPSGIQAEL
ncbi:hypothetical protein G9A89_006930 [Geosiphon pyriformis]|nr:hypothetical protein G9A89_006930 [Geosiphon pyriformis]